MVTAKTPFLLKKIYHSLIWDFGDGSKDVFLTFDDGPDPDVTPLVMEILNRYQAKATFFCIGRNVERNEHLFHMLGKEGHSVGNHTYSHLKGWKTSNVEYFADIELASLSIKSPLFRPPYGKIKRSQLIHLRAFYNIIMWDVLSGDYNPDLSREKCLGNVIKHVNPGSIIVFHDSAKACVNLKYSLPRSLEYLKERGFTMKPIPFNYNYLP